MCPSDGESAARAQRYASQLEQLFDEEGLAAAMVGEVEIPTKHGGSKAGEYIPGLATIEARSTRECLGHFSYANSPSHRIFEIWRVRKVADRP